MLEVVDAIFLLLHRAHLISVGCRDPVVLSLEAVVPGVGAVYDALEVM